jgi:NADPH-dependent 2,4-dienoyl-CoA reductase/sulfur reductase-like enzyme/nitrite reductase/ring-hydroxylating ferredoxin subunit
MDKSERPNLADGIAGGALQPGDMLLGRVGDDEVLLVRTASRFLAVSPYCTHYHGSLVDGLVVGETVRCPLHHSCFSLRNGALLRAPALDPLDCWKVDQQGDMVFVREKAGPATQPSAGTLPRTPTSVVIIGGGGAGLVAADTLRREGYDGPITIISAEEDPPCDRPNLSKDYLAGEAQEDWMPLRAPEYFNEQRIELLLGTRVQSVDALGRNVVLTDGTHRPFGALLIATGADPVRPPIPGADSARVHYLRSFADSRAIIAKAATATHVVVVGASFIGLEVAASLRSRGIAVDVVAPDRVPLERVMGREIGHFVQGLHVAHGVTFHLGTTVTRVDDRTVTLSDGTTLDADFVVMGVGVRPATALAESAGLALDRGIVVNEHLETSVPGIFAAGDVARWPDRRSGERVRIEHWVVAERQGQAAARAMLGHREPFDAVPFFWSQHYDVTIRYVGHAERWDTTTTTGSLDARDACVRFIAGGKTLAVATVSRDRDNLQAEVEFERLTNAP